MRKCPAIPWPDALRIYDVPESRLFSRGRYYFDCETKCRWSILYHKSANINKWSQLDAWSPKTETTGDGSFFIDRDGTHFRFILNYLRNGELILPEGATFLKELEAEAKFYDFIHIPVWPRHRCFSNPTGMYWYAVILCKEEAEHNLIVLVTMYFFIQKINQEPI